MLSSKKLLSAVGIYGIFIILLAICYSWITGDWRNSLSQYFNALYVGPVLHMTLGTFGTVMFFYKGSKSEKAIGIIIGSLSILTAMFNCIDNRIIHLSSALLLFISFGIMTFIFANNEQEKWKKFIHILCGVEIFSFLIVTMWKHYNKEVILYSEFFILFFISLSFLVNSGFIRIRKRNKK